MKLSDSSYHYETRHYSSLSPESVDGHVVPLVRLQVLPAVRLGALVDLPFLGAHEEQVLAVSVEVEAATPRQARERSLLRVILAFRLGVIMCTRRVVCIIRGGRGSSGKNKH